MVPAMIYLLGMQTQGGGWNVAVPDIVRHHGVNIWCTALTTKVVDLMLAIMLLIGSVTGAQLGTHLAQMRPEYLRTIPPSSCWWWRSALAGASWRPDEIYTIEAGMMDKRQRLLPLLMLPILAFCADRGERARAGPDVCSARSTFSTASKAQSCCYSARSYPGGRTPDKKPMSSSLKGPEQQIRMREKQKIAGIWVNADSLQQSQLRPAFAAIASSRPIKEIADERTAAI